MRKVVLFISMSLDGYLADTKGNIDWLNIEMNEEDTTYEDFYKDVDTVLLGYNTYEQVTTQLAVGNYPYKDSKSYVFTNKKIEKTEDNITFVDGDVVPLITELRNEPGKDIWLVGGAYLVKQLVEANLIDTYYIAVMPTLLGNGIPLFQPEYDKIDLKLANNYVKNDIAYLVYNRK